MYCFHLERHFFVKQDIFCEKSNETPKIYSLELKLLWKANKFKYSPKTRSVFQMTESYAPQIK